MKDNKMIIYFNALFIFRALSLQVGLVLISALHTKEAVGGVADPTGQHTIPQHGIDHSAFTITGPAEK